LTENRFKDEKGRAQKNAATLSSRLVACEDDAIAWNC